MAIECECSCSSESLRKVVIGGNYIAGTILIILGILRFIFISQSFSFRDIILSIYYMYTRLLI